MSTRSDEFADECGNADDRRSDGLTFRAFLAACDARCEEGIGLSIFDLEDALWRDHFESGASPDDAVEGVLDDQGYFDDDADEQDADD